MGALTGKHLLCSVTSHSGIEYSRFSMVHFVSVNFNQLNIKITKHGFNQLG